MDTIFALATAPGRAAVAILRLTGPDTRHALEVLAGKVPPPRRASVRRLHDAAGSALDEALVLWFPAPGSYTGEDSAELQLHGGVAVIEAVQDALLGVGLRLAEPGEFTRRAFENGKLDLAQAEGVADLVDAQTAAQARQALAQLGGALTQRHEMWREQVIEALAMLEANVDFPDEELPENLAARARPPLEALSADLAKATADADRGRRIRDGYRIALIGAPNAGKSSLLNLLAAREAAIVTSTPGTTRDIIEVPGEIAGFKVLFADTAGIRSTDDPIEAEGVRRAVDWARSADLRVWVIDGSVSDESWRQGGELVMPTDLVAFNKSDLGSGTALQQGVDGVRLSIRTGDGVADLRDALERRVVADLSAAEFPAATRLRHTLVLREAQEHLHRAVSSLSRSPELAAEDVRLAARALGRISGSVDPEDVLGAVFGKFCIGK